jgi:enterochelin esterase-like enzyme
MPGWERFADFLAEAEAAPVAEREALVDALLAERDTFPWVDGDRATFVYTRPGADNVAINLDRINTDPPFVPMERLEGTNLFYRTLTFEMDDLLDYMLAVNDPMTPLKTERDIVGRVRRYWRMDPLNPAGMQAATADVSVLRMPHARPFPDWARMGAVPRGKTVEHRMDSQQLGASGRKVWVHLPHDYDETTLKYPLLILQDGQWMVGPLQVPAIANALVKHGRMAPVVIAMVQSGDQAERLRDYVDNPIYYSFVMTELLPFLQKNYRVDATALGIGGASAGAIAAADVALQNPSVFGALLMFSPPLGKGPKQEALAAYHGRFETMRVLPDRIFHTVGRYEAKARFLNPSVRLADTLYARADTNYRFVELGSGHGLIAFRSILPEALAWGFPGHASL